MRLSKAQTKRWYQFSSLPDKPLLSGLGIIAKERFYLCFRYPFSGPVVICVERRVLAIGYRLAQEIFVEEYEKT